MNILANLFSSSYQELWKAIIRPYRDDYSDKDLGPKKFRLNKKFYRRTDFSLVNSRNIRIMCSFWEPYDEEREYARLPCVIYLHGNSSSRCEVIPNLKYLLPLNITVLAFDFTACGRSEGEYISLGWYEILDVECVINFLRNSKKVSTIGLWGRSMGAATSIIYASKDPTIAGIFLDSPFYSLNLLIDELSKDKVSLPDFLVRQIIKMIKQTVKDKADFNIDDIEPGEYAQKCFVPAFFCHGKDDTFVNVHHCNDLYLIYPGEKYILLVDGDHNSLRPNKLNENASEFFYNALKCKYIQELNDCYNGYKMIFRDWNNPKYRTPTGGSNNAYNDEVKVKIKNMEYRNYSEAVPVKDDENDENKQKQYFKKISVNNDNNQKYRFKNQIKNESNKTNNYIYNNKSSNNSNNKLKYNINNTFQPNENYNFKKIVFRQGSNSPKESYNFSTYNRIKPEMHQQILNNSKPIEYYSQTDNNIYEEYNGNLQSKQVIKMSSQNTSNIYDSQNKIYNIVSYNEKVVLKGPHLRKVQVNKNRVIRPYISPSPQTNNNLNRTDILDTNTKSIKKMSPSSINLNSKYNNQNNDNYVQKNSNNHDKMVSSDIYYNENNISMNPGYNNYNIYNNNSQNYLINQNQNYP